MGLSAAQLLPSAEFAGLSVRANVDYAFVAGGFPLQDTWQLLLPVVLTQYSPLYIGATGLGFAWLGVWFIFSRQAHAVRETVWTPSPRAGTAFLLAATVLALLLAYGSNGFLYPIFYRFAPGWNLFRGQERAAYLVTLGLSALAGYGALASQAMPQRSRSWWATAYTAVAIGAVYLFGLLWQLPGRTAIGQNQFLVIAALTVTLVSVYAVLLRTPGWSRRRWLWLIGLAAANLFVVNMGTNAGEFDPARKTILAPEVQAVQAAVDTTAADANGLPGRVYNEFRSYEDYGMRAGVEDVWGSSPLRLGRYAALFEEFPLDRMWRLLGVEHVLTWRKELFGPTELLGEFPQATDTTYLHRLPAPHPRAWLVSAVQPADDEEALALLADHQFDLDTTAVLAPGRTGTDVQGGDVTAGAAGLASAAKAQVQLQQRGPADLHIEVQDSPGGLLVIAENWMPGWRMQNVTCDGDCPDEAPFGLPAFEPQRANLTLVGVPVPAGSFTFDLVYRPDSIRWGLWISGVTLLVLAVLAAWRGLAHRESLERHLHEAVSTGLLSCACRCWLSCWGRLHCDSIVSTTRNCGATRHLATSSACAPMGRLSTPLSHWQNRTRSHRTSCKRHGWVWRVTASSRCASPAPGGVCWRWPWSTGWAAASATGRCRPRWPRSCWRSAPMRSGTPRTPACMR